MMMHGLANPKCISNKVHGSMLTLLITGCYNQRFINKNVWYYHL